MWKGNGKCQMPSLTIIVSPDYVPGDPRTISEFLAQSATLCQEILMADKDKVQVQILAAMAPMHGRPVAVEVRYRSNRHRGSKIIEKFMQELDKCCLDAFAVTPRIRCFPQKGGQLHARN
jgi:hypothetical protein